MPRRSDLNARRLRLLLGSLILVTGCGPTSGAGQAVGRSPNPADVAFAQDMLIHHQQGVQPSRLVDDRTSRTELVGFARTSSAEERAEVHLLQGWLQQRGKPGAAAAASSVAPATIPGLLGPGQFTWLARFRARRFDLAFLTAMATHHQGALEIAETELSQGSAQELLSMARQILRRHGAEPRQLQAWEDAWS